MNSSRSAFFLSAFSAGALSGTSVAAAPAKIDFAREIRPILSNNCFQCHGPDDKKRKGGGDTGLRLDTAEGAFAAIEGAFAVVPGKPDKSAILTRIHSTDADEVMPPLKTGKKITEKEASLLRRWIEEGATYAGHWAYTPPVRREPSAAPHSAWNDHPVDRFLYNRLTAEGLKVSPEADRPTLARRVALDLTGLPPSLAELEAFERDRSPDSYARYVDQMLAKQAFGEHWARLWMDLARYADSAGYPSDPGRSIWAFRDYTIRAFNQNKPFDQFTIEQLAGDLLPNPTEEQLIATAFHRNTMTNNEGGTSDEEFRTAAVIDRVNTTWSVWMGTSMACAQCHTHKFDPLTQHEYFSFYALLNQTEDADRNDEAPLHSFYLREESEAKTQLERKLAGLEEQFKVPHPEWKQGFAGWDAAFPRAVAWQAPTPRKVRSMRGAAASVREDGSVLVGATDKGNDKYSLDLPLGEGAWGALKLETVADAKLPGSGASHGANGAFVLDALRATLIPGGVSGKPARFVRVELTGATRPLQIAEVEVFAGEKNIAASAVATSSPENGGAAAARALDGRRTGEDTSLVTRGEKPGEFLEVDLGGSQRVERLRITVPSSGGYYLGGFKVVLLDEGKKPVWTRLEADLRETSIAFEPQEGTELKFRAVYATATAGSFELNPVAGLKPKDPANRNKGWNVANSVKPQGLTLLLERPLQVKDGDVLRVELDSQTRKKEQHLASFSVKLTSDSGAELAAEIPANMSAMAVLPAEKRTPQQTVQWEDFYIRNYAPEAKKERELLAASKKELEAMKPNTVPILRELAADKQRVTKVQLRGNFQNLGDEVFPGVPAVLPAIAASKGAKPNRLDMAKWIVSPENPLTSRVLVNRFWEALFGVGIVRTSEEFGAQGEMPVHADLLDWLATEFVRTGWNTKGFLKLLVTSAAYRQSSVVTAEVQEKDPENRFLARGPRFRSSAEVLRDQALFAGGLLSEKLYGKPVRPPKPDMGLSTAFGRGNDWTTSTGEDRYRRAIYTEVRRNSPYPSFSTFDAPNREVCTLRRGRTNTPLQALVTLNDPAFIEAAQGLARRVISEAGPEREQRIRHAFRLVLSRAPSETELRRLGMLLQESWNNFSADKERALKMAVDPIGPLPSGADPVELATWTAFSNVLLNLDEVLMRR
jgi:hypothetical protein